MKRRHSYSFVVDCRGCIARGKRRSKIFDVDVRFHDDIVGTYCIFRELKGRAGGRGGSLLRGNLNNVGTRDLI